ncbi:MAG: FliA/WhiG family RNA polymerase sigma factor [Sporolactobacillus sp.]
MAEANANEADYWNRWYATRDKEAANFLLQQYVPLVHYHVQRISASLPKSVDRGDLQSFGLIGLYDALEKFDQTRDLKFDTYASFRVRGAILDGLRKQDWMPRSMREKSKWIEHAAEVIEQREMRTATLEEVAAACTMTAEEVSQIVSEGLFSNLLSINETSGERSNELSLSGIEDTETIRPEEHLLAQEGHRMLIQEIDKLGDKERLVVSLFYFDGLTLTEIGQVMNLSTSRISQIHSKALFKLRQFLGSAKSNIFHG